MSLKKEETLIEIERRSWMGHNQWNLYSNLNEVDQESLMVLKVQ